MYLIQGRFCQEYKGFGIGYAPTEGAVAVVSTSAISVAFSGMIFQSGIEGEKTLIGEMSDHFGKAELSDISITDAEICFTKTYEEYKGQFERGISYTLHRGKENMWVGEYSLIIGVTGPVRCVVTEVPDEFFQDDLKTFAHANGFVEEGNSTSIPPLSPINW